MGLTGASGQNGGCSCLAVIVPCYNEASTIDHILSRVLARPEVAEVIVVDDGSTDSTWQRLQPWPQRDPRVRLLRHPHNQGKGAAIRTALPYLHAPFVLIQDADLEYDPADYPRLLEPLLARRADAVYGTRFGPGAHAQTPWWHRWGNLALTWLANRITGLRLTDEATCYKLLPRETLQRLSLQENGFGFCPEVTAKLAWAGSRIEEVPIHYRGRSRDEGKKIRWRDGWHALRCLWKYSRRPVGMSNNFSSAPSTERSGEARQVQPFRRTALLVVLVLPATFYAWHFLRFTGLIPEWGRWYSVNPYYRLQVAALLRGDLALSRDPATLVHDLCWSEGGVHQVWGLGIPLWHLPFEIVTRMFGSEDFPDMLALGFAMAVTAALVMYALFTMLIVPTTPRETVAATSPSSAQSEPATPGQIAHSGPLHTIGREGDAGHRIRAARWIALMSLTCLLLWFPPLLRLTSGFSIYRQAVLYEYLVGSCLLSLLLLLAARPTPRKFWVLCALAGYGMLVRPTLVFHGAAAVMAGTVALGWKRRDLWTSHAVSSPSGRPVRDFWLRQVLPGLAIYVLWGGVLFATNLARFGNGFEFGHRLNIQPGMHDSMYSTRFDYLFRHAPLGEAARELFGLLFLPKVPTVGSVSSGSDLLPWLSSIPRWREMEPVTYDLTYVPWILAGWTLGGFALWRGRQPLQHRPLGSARLAPDPSLERAIALLALQSVLATAALAAFYLRNCVISTRYMFDFAPAFAAAMTAAFLAWVRFWEMRRHSRRWSLLTLIGLAAWFSGQAERASMLAMQPGVLNRPRMLVQKNWETRQPVRIPDSGTYTSPEEAEAAGMLQYGGGWQRGAGRLQQSAYFFIRDPEFVELDLAVWPSTPLQPDPRWIRAKIGLEFLRLQQVEPTPTGWRLRFAGPQKRRYQYGIQPLFVATVPPEFLGKPHYAPWQLLQLRWRGAATDQEEGPWHRPDQPHAKTPPHSRPLTDRPEHGRHLRFPEIAQPPRAQSPAQCALRPSPDCDKGE